MGQFRGCQARLVNSMTVLRRMLDSTAPKAMLLIRFLVGWAFPGGHSTPKKAAEPTSLDSALIDTWVPRATTKLPYSGPLSIDCP
jgi:hypothetical protein